MILLPLYLLFCRNVCVLDFFYCFIIFMYKTGWLCFFKINKQKKVSMNASVIFWRKLPINIWCGVLLSWIKLLRPNNLKQAVAMFWHKKHIKNFRKLKPMHPDTLKRSQDTNYLIRCYQKLAGERNTLKNKLYCKRSL